MSSSSKPNFDHSESGSRQLASKKRKIEDESDSTEFSDLKQSSFDVLDRLKANGRVKCPYCGKSGLYYCINCLVPLGGNDGIPHITLPLNIDILHHCGEKRSKSTALHACVLAPHCTKIIDVSSNPEFGVPPQQPPIPTVPGERVGKVRQELPTSASTSTAGHGGKDKGKGKEKEDKRKELRPLDSRIAHCPLPDYDPETTVILFPAPGSKLLSELPANHLRKLEKVVVIDSTWNQCNRILNDKRLSTIPKIRLGDTYKTMFWRYQNHGPEYLATLEAMFYILREYKQAISSAIAIEDHGRDMSEDVHVCGPGAGPVCKDRLFNENIDDMLFYYVYQYWGIQDHYSKSDKRFTPRHTQADSYIKSRSKQ